MFPLSEVNNSSHLCFIQQFQHVFSLAARSVSAPTGALYTHLFPPGSITRGPGGSRLVTDTFRMVALGIGPGLTWLFEPAVPGVTWTQIFAQATLTKRPGWAEEKTNKTPSRPENTHNTTTRGRSRCHLRENAGLLTQKIFSLSGAWREAFHQYY